MMKEEERLFSGNRSSLCYVKEREVKSKLFLFRFIQHSPRILKQPYSADLLLPATRAMLHMQSAHCHVTLERTVVSSVEIAKEKKIPRPRI